jgi:putative redox protein
MIDCETDRPNEFPASLHVRTHTVHVDVLPPDSTDSAPSPHDYFDASLAACKAMTAMWYARKNKIALERVDTHVERDASQERTGKYVLKVRLGFHGPMSDEDRARLQAAVVKCPVHKLMTTTEVVIETE